MTNEGKWKKKKKTSIKLKGICSQFDLIPLFTIKECMESNKLYFDMYLQKHIFEFSYFKRIFQIKFPAMKKNYLLSHMILRDAMELQVNILT